MNRLRFINCRLKGVNGLGQGEKDWDPSIANLRGEGKKMNASRPFHVGHESNGLYLFT